MADVVLQLEDFVFADFEVPNEVAGGGDQTLVAHRLVGGVKIVDVMGRDDADIEWSGVFLGSGAVERARYLDNLRITGQQIPLTWDAFSYTVVVRKFKFVYERFYQIRFTITCEVVSDDTTAPSVDDSTSADDAIGTDMDSANTLSTNIADPQLTGLMGTLNTAVGAVTTFANAAQSTINSVLSPLSAVQARVNTLIGSTDATIGAATGFGGVVAGSQYGTASIALTSQLGSVMLQWNLLQMRAACGRMSNNLNSIYSSDNTVDIGGGNLFQVATEQYGDPMGWTDLAQANGITNPFLTGEISTLTVPPKSQTSDGILAF